MKLFKKKYSPIKDQVLKLFGKDIHVGRFTYGAKNIFIHTWGEPETLKIGRYCSIAGKIQVYLGGSHRVDWISTYPFGTIYHDEIKAKRVPGHPKSNGDVIIGNDVWIGHGATIMSGVILGDGAVVGANAHVIKDVPPYAVVAGNPATIIKTRFSPSIIELLLKWRWWEFSADKVDLIAGRLCSEPSIDLVKGLIAESANWQRD